MRTSRPLRTILPLAALGLLACASAALVAQMRDIPDAPGRWKPWTFTAYRDTRTLLGARPADVKGLEAQLLRLNEIIKSTGGYASGSGGLALARFRRAPEAGCDPLVRPNWSLFNPALPRSAPQLLIISRVERCLDTNRPARHPGGCIANMRLRESIDKAALLTWLQ